MKERPILFKAPMVQAILEGRKTQTRRVMKHQPDQNGIRFCPELGDIVCRNDHLPPSAMIYRGEFMDGHELNDCPYGKIGDRLWVRESWRADANAADDSLKPSLLPQVRPWYEADGKAPDEYGKLRPSLFMPRWASRIDLEIVDIRVERLQDISEADSKAEGVYPIRSKDAMNSTPAPVTYLNHREAFITLWESMNGAGPWDENPWLWVIEFKKLEDK